MTGPGRHGRRDGSSSADASADVPVSGGETSASRFARILFHDRPPRHRLASVAVGADAWPVGGAQLAVLDRGRVLLQFRPWPPGWELPGGHCEPGEDPADTARREAEEETGHTFRALGLVGVYSWQGLRAAGDAVYLGEISGGGRAAASRPGRSASSIRTSCPQPSSPGAGSGSSTRSPAAAARPRSTASSR